ncbi:MAG: putative nuclease (RNAse H fold) [Chloroflexi bacterium]|nr:MAG: putative nuclease (RNAse H fold) [Chloroflexota bacterium]
MRLGNTIDAMAGAALKAYEDRMDAVICAYVAAHVWRWGARRNWTLGPAGSGSIVLPALRPDINRSDGL